MAQIPETQVSIEEQLIIMTNKTINSIVQIHHVTVSEIMSESSLDYFSDDNQKMSVEVRPMPTETPKEEDKPEAPLQHNPKHVMQPQQTPFEQQV